jgi:hypothetical protein
MMAGRRSLYNDARFIMNFLRKKDSKSSKINKDEWLIAEGFFEDERLFLRTNPGLATKTNKQRYPFKIGIAIPFRSPRDDGLLDNDESLRFNRIEDTILDRFKANDVGMLCMVITTQGMREFVIYSKTSDISDLIENTALLFPEYEFQHIIEEDKEWNVFKAWMGWLESKPTPHKE